MEKGTKFVSVGISTFLRVHYLDFLQKNDFFLFNLLICCLKVCELLTTQIQKLNF